MSLVPSTHNTLSLSSLRNALRPLKEALDERDNWEMLARADEAEQVRTMALSGSGGRSTSTPAVRAAKGRSSGRGSMTAGSDRRPKIPKTLGRQIFVTHCIINVNIVTSASLPVFYNHTLTQGADSNGSLYAGVFDCFWILKAKWTYRSQQAPGSTTSLPVVLLAKEYTGGTPSTLAAIQGYETVKERCLAPGQTISVTVAPRFQSTAGTVAGGEASVGWLNTALSSAVPWSGCVIAAQATSGGTVSLLGQIDMWTAYGNGD